MNRGILDYWGEEYSTEMESNQFKPIVGLISIEELYSRRAQDH